MEVDSNHRSNLQQIYSLSPLATRESIHIGLLKIFKSPNNLKFYHNLKQNAISFYISSSIGACFSTTADFGGIVIISFPLIIGYSFFSVVKPSLDVRIN